MIRETLKAVLPTGRVRPRPGRAPPGEADRLNDISETLANDFFFRFRFFLISKFKNQNRFVDDDDSDDDNDDDDDRKKSKKTKCVSNDRSGHDDQNEYRIIKIGAILEG